MILIMARRLHSQVRLLWILQYSVQVYSGGVCIFGIVINSIGLLQLGTSSIISLEVSAPCHCLSDDIEVQVVQLYVQNLTPVRSGIAKISQMWSAYHLSQIKILA